MGGDRGVTGLRDDAQRSAGGEEIPAGHVGGEVGDADG